jgi:uncharacterized protein YndB with AHSA1/START domain
MRRAAVASDRHGPAVIEFPNDLEVVIRREFDAPIQLVFDVATKPEHVRKTFAPPARTVQTWRFDGWPDVEAVETMDLLEAGEVTKLTYRLAFRDQAGRDHMTRYDGLLANFDHEEALLRSLLDR